MGDIRPLVASPQVYAKADWYTIRPMDVAVFILGAGFPCRELSQVNQTRRGLDQGDTTRFQEAKALLHVTLEERHPEDPVLRVVFENFQWMSPCRSMQTFVFCSIDDVFLFIDIS